MSNTLKTAEEIIDETVKFYSTVSNRSVENESCKYISTDGKMCAFGRCAKDPSILMEGHGVSVHYVITKYGGQIPIDDVLKDEYKGQEPNFWNDLQWLHDSWAHWDSNGISEKGREYVDYIKTKYK